MRHRTTHAVWFSLLGVLLAMLVVAACSTDENADDPTVTPAATPTATIPAVITRVITPGPTRTPLPTPTLAYDLNPVAGRWALRILITIENSTFADRFTYNTNVDLLVNIDGSVSGGGSFASNIFDVPCNAQVNDHEPLRYVVQGTTRPVEGTIWVDFTLVPDAPNTPENYTLYCPDFEDIRTWSDPILWPTLADLGRLQWSFALASGQQFDFTADLAAPNRGPLDGMLSAVVSLRRN